MQRVITALSICHTERALITNKRNKTKKNLYSEGNSNFWIPSAHFSTVFHLNGSSISKGGGGCRNGSQLCKFMINSRCSFLTKAISNLMYYSVREELAGSSKLVRRSISALPGKGYRDVFSFQKSRRQNGTVSRTACRSQVSGSAGLK